MYLHLPKDINSVCLYTNTWKLRLLIGKLLTKNVCNIHVDFQYFLFWTLMVQTALVIDLYGHAGLCYMTGEA